MNNTQQNQNQNKNDTHHTQAKNKLKYEVLDPERPALIKTTDPKENLYDGRVPKAHGFC